MLKHLNSLYVGKGLACDGLFSSLLQYRESKGWIRQRNWAEWRISYWRFNHVSHWPEYTREWFKRTNAYIGSKKSINARFYLDHRSTKILYRLRRMLAFDRDLTTRCKEYDGKRISLTGPEVLKMGTPARLLLMSIVSEMRSRDSLFLHSSYQYILNGNQLLDRRAYSMPVR